MQISSQIDLVQPRVLKSLKNINIIYLLFVMYIQVWYLASTFTCANVSHMQKEKVHQTTS